MRKTEGYLYSENRYLSIETGRQANLILLDVIDEEIRIIETYS